MFQFNVCAALAGGNSPYSPGFESLATRTLQGVQSAAMALVYNRSEVYGIGGEGGQELVERPQAELQMAALFSSGQNERSLGFIVSPSGQISALAGLNEERNYYLQINQRNSDANANPATDYYVMSLGNGALSHYDFSAQIGQPTTTNFSVIGLNLLVQSGVNQPLPSVLKQDGTNSTGTYTLPVPGQQVTNYFDSAPSSIQLTFSTGCAIGAAMSGSNSCPIEAFSFSIDFPRGNVKDLGWAYPNVRPIQWPVTINIKADARLNGIQTDALNRFGCSDSGHSFSVAFKGTCSTYDDFQFQFNGAKLTNQSVTTTVGGGSTRLALEWSLQVYDVNRVAPTSPNFFINASGTPYTSIIFPQVGYVSGSYPLTMNLSTGCFLTVLNGPGMISGNYVFVTDETSTVVIRTISVDGSDTRDLTIGIS